MNYKVLSIAVLGLFLSGPVNSASIYKCSKTGKSVIFTDKPCPANTASTLIHKETEEEIQNRQQAEKISTIKSLIEGNQLNAAKEYAAKNNLSEYYFNQLSVYSKQKVEEDRRKVDDEKQQQLAIEQQRLALQRQQMAVKNAQIQQPNNRNYYGGYPYYGYPYYGTYSIPYYRSGTTYSSPSTPSQPMMPGTINPQSVMPGTINPQAVMPGTINPHQPFQQNNQQHEHHGRR